ncbi:amidohydrolase family protein [Adhaeretor mobilis]|uniref:Aminodeoxyfutalosine deaminase n=1 Tax=Adhaeretor mobilis TaxID=1930276 RepID=A0A517MXC1_9BACT|nr:amidohydrolase family protein [Adhaeretor mobilis]QDS99513.1 Aminodeoxyfutalosine deaminase [Adhaeretor mobilis]
MTPFSLRARWVLPVDQPPIEDGVVTIADGLILTVGKASSHDGPVEDLGDVALLPGFVNTHTHLEFSDHQTPLGPADQGLPAWIRSVIADRQRSTRDASAAIIAGLAESLTHGVTTIADIATSPSQYYYGVAPCPNLILLQEAIGFSTARTNSVFNDITNRLEVCATHGERSEDPGMAYGISPHAPYTVSLALVEKLVSLAAQEKLPIAMHLAESQEELQLLREGNGPFRELLEEKSMWDAGAIPANATPLDFLKRLSAAGHSLVVHGNYLNASELDYLSEHRGTMSVVFCPRTHRYFNHTKYPLEEMLAAGVRVVAGTDSRASNPDLSILAELRAMAQNYPSVAVSRLLAMGTLEAAMALGWQDRAGSITPGKYADLVALPCAAPSEPVEELLHSESRPARVWLHGELAVS